MSTRSEPRRSERPASIPGYEILNLIGTGGQGAVYRARQLSLDRIVAIKLLSAGAAGDAEHSRRFVSEARLASQLHHPNILGAVDIGDHEGQLYFVMEYVSGPDARTVLRERGRLSEAEVIDIGHQMAGALQYTAERGIFHGDIKPENLVIAHDGTVKIVDFGIAGLIRRKRSSSGTEGFIAPEVLAGERADARSDLYSLGVTLFELLTGRMPEPGSSVRDQWPGVSPDLAGVLDRLIQVKPNHRFRNGADLGAALATARDGASPVQRPTRPRSGQRDGGRVTSGLERPPRQRSLRLRLAARSRRSGALSAVLILGVFVAGWVTFERVRVRVTANVANALPSAAAARGAPRIREEAAIDSDGVVSHPETPSRTAPVPPPNPDGAASDDSRAAPAPPSLVFRSSVVDVIEGRDVEVVLESMNIAEPLVLSFEILDAAGRAIEGECERLERRATVGRTDEAEITYRVPWIPGHAPESRRLVARQGTAEAAVEIRIAPENRAPVIERPVGAIDVAEGADAVVIPIGVSDPDEDPIDWLVEGASDDLIVSVEGGRLRVAARRRPGHLVREESIRLVATDGQGGRCDVPLVVRIADVDQPSRMVLEASGSSVTLYRDHDVLRVAIGKTVKADIRITDPDQPVGENLRLRLTGSPKDLRGLELSERGAGLWTLQGSIPARAQWGPYELRLEYGEEGYGVAQRLIRIQVLRHFDGVKGSRASNDDLLGWCERHQLPDGRMACTEAQFRKVCRKGEVGCDGYAESVFTVGITALAAIAALRSGRGDGFVTRCVDSVILQQDREGCFGSREPHLYNHFLGAECVALAWHLLGDPRYRESAEKAVEFTLAAQNPYKAWRYRVAFGENDTSASVWALRSLFAARMAGLDVPPMSLVWAFDFLEEMTERETGRVGYNKRGSRSPRNSPELEAQFPSEESEAMTAAAVCVLLMDPSQRKSALLTRPGLELVHRKPPVWDQARGSIDFYYWQHATAAYRVAVMTRVLHRIDRSWARLARDIKDQTRADGCFDGSIDAVDPWAYAGGRPYSTAILALALANLEFTRPMVGELVR